MKESKEKFLSQCETEASISPMLDMLSGKKKKKKNKRKSLDNNDSHLNESFSQDDFQVTPKLSKENRKSLNKSQLNFEELPSPEKKKTDKKKEKKHSLSSLSFIENSDEDTFEDKKKKKKKSKHNSSSQEMNSSTLGLNEIYEENVSEGETKSKKDKDKKRKHSFLNNLELTENCDFEILEESPKKKKKKSKKYEEKEDREEEETDFSLKSPLKINLKNQESFTSKSAKKKEAKEVKILLNTPEKIEGKEANSSSSSKKKKKSLTKNEWENESEDNSFAIENGDIKQANEMEESFTAKSANKKKGTKEVKMLLNTPEKIKGKEANCSSSSSKHKKKSLSKNELKKDNISVKENGDIEQASEMEDDKWTVEEELTLINRIQNTVSPNDNYSFRIAIQKIDWNKISFSNRSADECHDVFTTLLSTINKYKTLSMLLDEAKEAVVDSSHRFKRVITPKNRFIKDYLKNHRSDDASSEELRMEASAAWLNLSKEVKKQYQDRYEQEKRKCKGLKPLPPKSKIPKIPFEFYYSKKVNEDGFSKSQELRLKMRKMFHVMKIEEKGPYVHESFKDWADYIENFSSFKESNPEENIQLRFLPCRTLFNEYLTYLGIPRCSSNVKTYIWEDMKKNGYVSEEKNNLVAMNNLLAGLSQQQKDAYEIKFKETVDSHDEKYRLWKEKQDRAIILVLETYLENIKKTSKTSTTKTSKTVDFQNIVKTTMIKPIFSDEPEKPLTAHDLFVKKFVRRKKDYYKTENEMKEACNSAWKLLPKQSKNKYVQREREYQAAFKKDLLEYVRNLGEGVGVYLGFRRKELSTYFKEDIFKSEFPNDQYPVYEKVTKSKSFDNVVEVSFKKTTFPNEPDKPPSTAFKIFCLRFERHNKERFITQKAKTEACNEAWKLLQEETKLKYSERLNEIKAAYKEKLLEFVRNLGSEAKTYLGFKRKESYQYFKEDIFQEEFPNAEFPIYVTKERTSIIPTFDESSSDMDYMNTSPSTSKITGKKKYTKAVKTDEEKDKDEILRARHNQKDESDEEEDSDKEDDDDSDKEEDNDSDKEDDDDSDKEDDNDSDKEEEEDSDNKEFTNDSEEDSDENDD